MNYKKMVEDINKLVDNDWFADIDEHSIHNTPFTQVEALQMAEVLGQVFMISHAIYCGACGRKYQNSIKRSEKEKNA